MKISAKEVRGFNYHATSAHSALEEWTNFDIKIWERDFKLGKSYFPKMNTVRVWLSWNAFCYLGDRFIDEFRQVIDLCKRESLFVIPVIFNRWHDPMVDCDGIYLDHFVPGSSWFLKYGNLFEDYIDTLMKEFGNEEQILVWDLCGEPFAYGDDFPLRDVIMPYEIKWLETMYHRIKSHQIVSPVGIGTKDIEDVPYIDHICDVHLTHIYFRGETSPEVFDTQIADFAKELKERNKEAIIGECCWGSFEDAKRVEMMKVTLDAFRKYNLGFVAHSLIYSNYADLHDFGDGRTSPEIGNLCFIKKNLELRKGHEIINQY